ncbi:unnamed protein product, partial [Owenia fusiformis]
VKSIKTKTIYWILVDNLFKEPNGKKYLNSKFNFSEEDWKHIFTLPFKTVREPRIQCLQYKLVLNVTPNNQFLTRKKIKNSNLCDFCKNDKIDDTIHFFIECPNSSKIWDDFKKIFNIDLTIKDIIVGKLDQERDHTSKAINFCILYIKSLIHKSRLVNTKITFMQIKEILKYKINDERNIANLNGTLESFGETWRWVIDRLNQQH